MEEGLRHVISYMCEPKVKHRMEKGTIKGKRMKRMTVCSSNDGRELRETECTVEGMTLESFVWYNLIGIHHSNIPSIQRRRWEKGIYFRLDSNDDCFIFRLYEQGISRYFKRSTPNIASTNKFGWSKFEEKKP